ncbi:cytochrome P450 [Aspergillus stella-maris]|uniref:cytochrome P450 n=1 Tax=Aspergillus stella-maris TaxID=1810926 RepID=UPI003CCDC885
MLLLVASGFFVCLVYLLGFVIYRLWLSPLGQFPGPKFAAATLWYETYHDAFWWRQYTFEISRMHEKYGPIVRISPHELHVNDPEYYEVLYSCDSPWNKYAYSTKLFGVTRSMVATVGHYHHRLLRSNMNPYFSTARVRKQEPFIQSLVDKLCKLLQAYKGTGKPTNLQHAFTCFTTDVTIAGSAKSGVYVKEFPWLGLVFSLMPQWLLSKERCNKIIQSKEELNWLNPNGTATLTNFEQMPYPTSVMLEGLRLSYGLSSRQERVAPDRNLQFRQWSIPARTPVGLTSTLIHHNETIFPSSTTFIPKRWMDSACRKYLEYTWSRSQRGLGSSRESRNPPCLSNIVRRLDLEMYETMREDVTIAHDLFLPFAKEGRKGVRVVVR